MLIEVKHRKPDIQKLLAFGFEEMYDRYTYSVGLLTGQMKMTVDVSKDGAVSTQVLDSGSGEEYVLHLVQTAAGSFVGRVRAEYDAVLDEILSACFEYDVFKSQHLKRVVDYIRNKYGDEMEHLWPKSPENAIVRRKDNGKWYMAVLTISKRKLDIDSDELVEIIDLRMKPDDVETVVDRKKYFPGFHMNKKHWVTVCMDGTVPFD